MKNVKDFTINKIWSECRRLWEHIEEELRRCPWKSVGWIKQEWMEANGYGQTVAEDCFFCEFTRWWDRNTCEYCPGKLVDPNFDCMHLDYNWYGEPVAFREEIERLNKLRTTQ